MSVPTKRQARQLEIEGFEPVAVTFSNGATRITKSYDGWSCTTIVQPGSIAVFPDNLDDCLVWAAAIRDGQSPKGTLSDKRRMLALGFEPSMAGHYSGYQMKWRNPKWELAFYVPARTIMLTERATGKTVKGQLLAPLLNIMEETND